MTAAIEQTGKDGPCLKCAQTSTSLTLCLENVLLNNENN